MTDPQADLTERARRSARGLLANLHLMSCIEESGRDDPAVIGTVEMAFAAALQSEREAAAASLHAALNHLAASVAEMAGRGRRLTDDVERALDEAGRVLASSPAPQEETR